jgi:uncharacterized damage-inducible protein DinB
MANAPEVWLTGPLAGIPALLQPVAHSLLQSREELHATLAGLSPADVWVTPGGAASVGFHARHAAGSLDRLFTYARGEQLNAAQKAALAGEGAPDVRAHVVAILLAEFDLAVDRALQQLRSTDESTLTDTRAVGRAQLPSTVVGLLFHAAEHTQRHMGQLMTTAKIVKGTTGEPENP